MFEKLRWYVDPERETEFTELEFVAEMKPGASYGLSAVIGLCDEEGLEEFDGHYWWKVVQGERSWIDHGVGQTFQECEKVVIETLESMVADMIKEDAEDS